VGAVVHLLVIKVIIIAFKTVPMNDRKIPQFDGAEIIYVKI
jgi:hypothetical protein